MKYLQGEVFDEKFNDVDYNNVSIDLSEYYLNDTIAWRGNGSFSDDVSKTDILKPLYVTFSGFWYTHF